MAANQQQLSLPSFVLATLVAGGGIMGFAKSGSLPSIIAGGTIGLLYSIGGYRIQNRQPYGVEICLLASIVLGASSIPRAIRGRKPVPTLLSVLATFGMVTYGRALRA